MAMPCNSQKQERHDSYACSFRHDSVVPPPRGGSWFMQDFYTLCVFIRKGRSHFNLRPPLMFVRKYFMLARKGIEVPKSIVLFDNADRRGLRLLGRDIENVFDFDKASIAFADGHDLHRRIVIDRDPLYGKGI